ncbi:hypothetical protein N9D63_03870 [Opitutales bacterium]|nr:hypothetical protein [Opitutales bacterium]
MSSITGRYALSIGAFIFLAFSSWAMAAEVGAGAGDENETMFALVKKGGARYDSSGNSVNPRCGSWYRAFYFLKERSGIA